MHFPCNNTLSVHAGCAPFASFPPQIHSPTSLTLIGCTLVLWLPDGLAKGRAQKEILEGRGPDISSCFLSAPALAVSSFQGIPLHSSPALSSNHSTSPSCLSSSTQGDHLILISPGRSPFHTVSPTSWKTLGLDKPDGCSTHILASSGMAMASRCCQPLASTSCAGPLATHSSVSNPFIKVH